MVVYPWPTIASCFILFEILAYNYCRVCPTPYFDIDSILSIFLIPSQWRISGINAWKRISLTPAIFSVRLKYSEARSAPRFLALYTRYYCHRLDLKGNEISATERIRSMQVGESRHCKISGRENAADCATWDAWWVRRILLAFGMKHFTFVTSPRARPSLRK